MKTIWTHRKSGGRTDNVQTVSTPLKLLSCQTRVAVTSCFAYKVIRDLESIDHIFINTQVIYRFTLAQVECTS